MPRMAREKALQKYIQIARITGLSEKMIERARK